MGKPRLTRPVLEGLAMLAGVVEAGGCADILGSDEDDPDTRQAWARIQRACRWVRAMQRHKLGAAPDDENIEAGNIGDV